MILFNVAKSVMEVFEMTGFADILTIESVSYTHLTLPTT